MGQAKRRREEGVRVVYHHTSTLRTNLLWMSGVIQVEGQSEGVIHPDLGEILTDATLRRPMRDFPPLVWFTRQIVVPRCLQQSTMMLRDKGTGEVRAIEAPHGAANAIALNRVALGFPVSSIPVVPWQQHLGYSTAEGRDLNESARAAGDDPNDWWVAEAPVDLLQMSEIWISPSIANPKLKRSDPYLLDVRRMVTLCRTVPGSFIPPSWMTEAQAARLGARAGSPVVQFRGGLVRD
ncbi:hypothetical protein [Roseicella sp. DB1501]|uniref:hypothetical protein n=1 Tax=Roseicella sp. DB1501 TaxID=2730925 RepID=UPI001491DFD7|nr:hypothetical protein [Roseicella sp. DB1501]NOG74047.1 hypothetical protein [Roseicella sp. DB1501]